MTVFISDEALGRLRAAKAATAEDAEMRELVSARDEVLARYSPSLQLEAIATLAEEVLRSFLYFENNKHWTGLNRQVNRICVDMDTTRNALTALVDEAQPIETRMEPVTAIKGMGKGIITAILHVAYPDRYGVWNNTSDVALIELGLMPAFERGASFGQRYTAINDVLLAVAERLQVDLWTLDALWWRLDAVDEDEDEDEDAVDLGMNQAPGPGQPTGKRAFALERHLHDYLFDHWDNLSLASDWTIFARPGEPEAGYEFTTPIGRIDLLARHRREQRWLVIELKRRASSDQVVGQVLRYIGWIEAHMAEPGETVEGLIVACEGEDKLHYAVSAVPSLTFMAYEVEFHLKPGPGFEEYARP